MSYQLPSSFLQKFTPKEIHELKRVFKEHDTDYAAAIPVTDLHTVLLKMGENVTPTQCVTILKQIPPRERESHVTFPEFLNLFYDLRTGGIALDVTTLISQTTIAASPSPAVSAPSPTPVATAPTATTVEKVPFFPRKSTQSSQPDDDDNDTTNSSATSPSPFGQRAQWPPAGSAPTTTSAPTPPAPPQKPQWQAGNGSQWNTQKTTPPKNNDTTASPAGGKPQWPPAASSPAPSAANKPQWPPAAATTPSPAKPQWPPAAPAQAERSPTTAKPSWPPAAQEQRSPSLKPSWPPASPAQETQRSPSLKPSWPPAAPSPAREDAVPTMTKAQWPPAASPTPAPAAPSPSTKPSWPPAQPQAPSPRPQAPSPARSPVPPPPSDAVSLDAHAIGVLQRRASAAAMYNANVTIHEVKGTASSVHSYSEEETAAFTEHINNCLQHDKDLAPVLPIRAKDGLFRTVSDGILLCKLVNAAVPETIDTRAVNLVKKSKPLNVYEMTENQNLCINAAKSIGCSVVNIGPTDLIEGRPILVLGLVWQIIKIQLTSTINLKNHPELVRLLLDGESLEEFMKLPPDQILLRWMNYHLKAAGHPKTVMNFSSDVQDATAYSVLLHQIAPQTCDLCHESIAEERAAHVIQNARRLQIETFLKPRDITSGNPKLNMSFVAQLFNTCPALDIVEADLKQLEEVLYDDVGDTREERVFRMWINSLGIDELYINHLFADLREGVNLLKVFDKIEKGIVAWQKVNLVAPNKFKKVENCNYCVVLGKQLKFSLVNIGGADIYEGNKKLILSIIWQTMRYQQLKLLSELARGRGSTAEGITDADIIAWANGKVRQAGGNAPDIVAFRDMSLADGRYLLSLVHAVEPRAVNWEMVTPGQTDDDKASNAKYAISCAQKIGATVFLTYEDIVEVKPKMMMTFVASLMSVDMHRSH